MKKIIGSILMAVFAVFLVCDPQFGVTNYTLEIDGAEAIVVEAIDTKLYYDVTSIAFGSHEFVVRAKNIWGDESDSVPFVFSRNIPENPLGIRLLVE